MWGKQYEPDWWSLLALCGKASSKEQWPLPALLSERKLPLQFFPWCWIIQFLPIYLWCLSSCCPHAGAQREWIWVSPCMGPLRGSAWDSRSFHLSQSQSPLVFTTKSYGTGTLGWGGLVWGWDPSLLGGTSASQDISPSFYLPHIGVGPACFAFCSSYNSWCGFFFNSVVVGLLFSSVYSHSEWLLFCSLVVILMWLWEEVSTMFISSATLTVSDKG